MIAAGGCSTAGDQADLEEAGAVSAHSSRWMRRMAGLAFDTFAVTRLRGWRDRNLGGGYGALEDDGCYRPSFRSRRGARRRDPARNRRHTPRDCDHRFRRRERKPRARGRQPYRRHRGTDDGSRVLRRSRISSAIADLPGRVAGPGAGRAPRRPGHIGCADGCAAPGVEPHWLRQSGLPGHRRRLGRRHLHAQPRATSTGVGNSDAGRFAGPSAPPTGASRREADADHRVDAEGAARLWSGLFGHARSRSRSRGCRQRPRKSRQYQRRHLRRNRPLGRLGPARDQLGYRRRTPRR